MIESKKVITEHRNSSALSKLQRLSEYATVSNHRYLVVVSGSYDWVRQFVRDYIAASDRNTVCFSDSEFTGYATIKLDKVEKYLGSEFDNIVFDACSGFFPNQVGQVEGLLKGGGLFLLLTPELDKWPRQTDLFHQSYTMFPYSSADMNSHFLARFTSLIKAEGTVSVVSHNQGNNIYHPDMACSYAGKKNFSVYASKDQKIAVEKIIHVAKGHRNRPLVILSDRGHGKSASLGIASAYLLQNELNHITVSGPGKTSVEAVFRHAVNILGAEAEYHDGKITYRHAIIEFIPPDELIRRPISTGILMIDEAASIPTPLLESLYHLYHRIVFSSTVYGYEGSGKGFELKFLKKIEQENPGVKKHYLDEPIRWSRNDPLENFFFKSFLLDAGMPDIKIDSIPKNSQINRISGKDLAKKEDLLGGIYSLLVSAHYKTTPNDLRMIIDSPYISIYYLEVNGQVYATILVSDEGRIDAELAGEICSGKRRINGHILPQTILSEFAHADAASLGYARIMRIAVIPALQEKGIGSGFLEKLVTMVSSSCDLVGASFGSDSRLLRFWARSGFSAVKIGHKKNAYSGHYSATVIKGLSKPGRELVGSVQNGFYENLLYTLTDTHRYLDCCLVKELLLSYSGLIGSVLTAEEKNKIRLFSDANKTFDSCSSLIQKLLLVSINNQTIFKLHDKEFCILIQRVIQRQEEEVVIGSNMLTGKKMLSAIMKKAVKELLLNMPDVH
ncbi:MAG TPA: tRNA(Met) cytidine acetyltransferase [Gammaproteobacteria bacterium]|nr:tRNA(Met) cytidine acetyltransferase [Gammaproteobacteria bacterium]